MLSHRGQQRENDRTGRTEPAAETVSGEDADRAVPTAISATVRGGGVPECLAERETGSAAVPFAWNRQGGNREPVGRDHLQRTAMGTIDLASTAAAGDGLKLVRRQNYSGAVDVR